MADMKLDLDLIYRKLPGDTKLNYVRWHLFMKAIRFALWVCPRGTGRDLMKQLVSLWCREAMRQRQLKAQELEAS